MTVDFSYPYQVTANTPAVATEVQSNFNDLLIWIKANYFQIDDTPKMNQQLTLPGDPTIPQHAVPLSYLESIIPAGIITAYAGAAAPNGYLLCDGQLYSQGGQYADLFAVIGVTYGGDATNFNVPDLQQRVPVGRDPINPPFDTLGADTIGVADSVLPEHVHEVAAYTHSASATGGSHSHGDNFSVASAGTHDHGDQLLMEGKSNGFTNETQVADNGGNRAGDLNHLIPDDGAHVHTVNGSVSTSASHAHVISVAVHASKDTELAGDPAITNTNYPPALILNYIIKT